jgi:hypothetical protein
MKGLGCVAQWRRGWGQRRFMRLVNSLERFALPWCVRQLSDQVRRLYRLYFFLNLILFLRDRKQPSETVAGVFLR